MSRTCERKTTMPQLTSLDVPPPVAPPCVAGALAEVPARIDGPVWLGPDAEGPLGGVTQSMLGDYLACRERFRVKYVLGLRPLDKWQKTFGYGNQWHTCEEHYAKKDGDWRQALADHTHEQMTKYPFQREEIQKWYCVCMVQFPEYIKFWSMRPDVLDRQPMEQEQVFDVPLQLPSGRVVRLRGKRDGMDLIPSQGGAFLCEHKTKGDIDVVAVQRQLKFDLQTMLYITAAKHEGKEVVGVKYNVVRRPLSGGKGSITPHKEKRTKDKVYKTKPTVPGSYTPAETDAEFYERLRRDYIADDPAYWFARFISRVSQDDLVAFRRQCLDPLLENVADDAQWWVWCLKKGHDHWDYRMRNIMFPAHHQRHYRTPFGTYSGLSEAGHTDYDEFLDYGTTAGLKRVDTLFDELQPGV